MPASAEGSVEAPQSRAPYMNVYEHEYMYDTASPPSLERDSVWQEEILYLSERPSYLVAYIL